MTDLEPFVATICWYGERTVDDRVVTEGAISTSKMPVPVISPTRDPYRGGGVIGKVEAAADGWDEGYATLNVVGVADRDAMPLDDEGNPIYSVGMSLDSIETFHEDGVVFITKARLVGVTITDEPAYPRAAMRFGEDPKKAVCAACGCSIRWTGPGGNDWDHLYPRRTRDHKGVPIR